MATDRFVDLAAAVRFSDDKATVTEVSSTERSTIAVWGVKPGQSVPAHTHPDGQDTWLVLRGELTYLLGDGRTRTIRAGQLDVAEADQIHGAVNAGNEDAVFVSIYSASRLTTIPV